MTDDDGSGTTGTIVNAAWIGSALYDKVDGLFTASSFTLESSHSGAEKALTVTNTSNTASASASLQIRCGGGSALRAVVQYGTSASIVFRAGYFPATSRWRLTDGSDNDIFYATSGRHFCLPELSADPGTSDLLADSAIAIYTKNDKLVFAYNNGGTITYISLDLDGSDTTWTHSTSAP